MKRILLLILVTILISCFAMIACSSPQNEATQVEKVDEKEKEEVPTEDPQIALDNEQVLEYLSLLGLDKNCSYELGGTFPSGVEGKDKYLVSVASITEEDFTAIETALESNGFTVASDISINEELKTKIYPYSNGESLYIEIVFSYGAEYFDVTFTPFT